MEHATVVSHTPKTSQRDSAARRILDQEAMSLQRRKDEAHKLYGRGPKIAVGRIKDKKLRTKLKSLEDKNRAFTLKAKDAEILLQHQSGLLEAETELERTYKVRQEDIVKNVDVATAKKGFELKLDGFGPYSVDWTRSGSSVLLSGRRGHVGVIDLRGGKLSTELHLQETVSTVYQTTP